MIAYVTSFFSIGKSGKDTLPLRCFFHWKKNAFLPKGKTPRKKQRQLAVISTTDSDRTWVVVAQSVTVTRGGYWDGQTLHTGAASRTLAENPPAHWMLRASQVVWACELSFSCRSLCPTILPFSNGSKISHFLLSFAMSSVLWREYLSLYVHTVPSITGPLSWYVHLRWGRVHTYMEMDTRNWKKTIILLQWMKLLYQCMSCKIGMGSFKSFAQKEAILFYFTIYIRFVYLICFKWNMVTCRIF